MHDILEPRHHMIDYVKFASADPQAMCVFFKQKTAYEIAQCLVGSEMCIRDSIYPLKNVS